MPDVLLHRLVGVSYSTHRVRFRPQSDLALGLGHDLQGDIRGKVKEKNRSSIMKEFA